MPDEIFAVGLDNAPARRSFRELLGDLDKLNRGFESLAAGFKLQVRSIGTSVTGLRKKLTTLQRSLGGEKLSGAKRIGPKLRAKAFHRETDRLLEDIARISKGLASISGTFGPRLPRQRMPGRAAQRGPGLRFRENFGAFGATIGGIPAPAAAAAIAVGGLTLAIGASAGAALSASNDYSRWLNTLEFATGTTEAAFAEFEFLEQASHDLGLDLRETTDAYSKWAAVTKGTTLQGQETRDIFLATARAAAAMGLSAEDTKGTLKALAQVLGKGRLSAEEYRQQIGDRMPIAMKAFIQASGLTEAAFLKQMEQGKILSEEILPKFDDALRDILGDTGPVENSERAWNRLQNQLFLTAASVGAELNPVVSELLNLMADLLRETRPYIEFLLGEGATALQVTWEALGGMETAITLLSAVLQSSGVSSAVAFTEALARVGGLAGLFHLLSAAVLESVASVVEFAGSLSGTLIASFSGITEKVLLVVSALSKLPGADDLGVTDFLADLAEAFEDTGEKAKKGGEKTAAFYRAAASRHVAQAADRAGQSLRKLSGNIKDLGNTGPPAADGINEIPKALQAIRGETEALLLSRELMDEFGVSVEEAQRAAKLLGAATAKGFKLSREEAIKLAKAWKTAKDALRPDELPAALRNLNDELADLATSTGIIRDFGVDLRTASDAARLMRDSGMSAADALAILGERADAVRAQVVAGFEAGVVSVREFMQATLSPEDFERWTQAQRLIDGTKTKAEKYREEVAKLHDLRPFLTDEQFSRIAEMLEAQITGWERIGMAAVDAGERAGGAWGRVLKGIGENMGKIVGALGEAANIAASMGDDDTAGFLRAGQSFVQGDTAGGIAGAVQASGFGQQGVSEFGGRSEGNFASEFTQLGALFGPWGAVIGAVVGSFVSKGADDFHAELTEAAGKAQLKITQAEGGLAEVAQQIEKTVETFLNEIQGRLSADLGLGGPGFEIHIREDRVRVVSQGIQKVFHDLDMALDFFFRGVLQANAAVDGLGEEMRNFFEGATQFGDLGDLEKLEKAFSLAERLDFEQTGLNEALLRQQREEIALAAEFGISIEKTLASQRKRLEMEKQTLEANARSILGATDFAGRIVDLTAIWETLSATAARQRDLDQARVAELENLIAAGTEAAAITGEMTDATTGERVAREGFREGLRASDEATEGFTRTLDESRRAQLDASREVAVWREELEALTGQLGEAFDPLDVETFAALWERTVADAGLALIQMIQAVEGPAANIEEQRQLQNTIFMLQLAAQIQAALLVLETMEFVSDASRALFEGVISDASKLFDDLASGRKVLDLGGRPGGGAGRRQKKLEEEQRSAEEAAQKLEEFRDELTRVNLNASSASGTLGDLNARLEELSARAAEAAEAGATPEEARRFQALGFREERERVLDPFIGAMGKEDFESQRQALEDQRRAALEESRAIAEAQAAALGLPVAAIFGNMAAVIEAGSKRLQILLAASVVDAFGLPIESTRDAGKAFSRQMADLRAAYEAGAITGSRYLQVVDQIQDAQKQALGGDVLALLDEYYSEVEGREDFRRQLEEARFSLEITNARIRFDMLVAEGALAADAVARIGGFLDFMESNPPDWDAFFDVDEAAASFSGGGRGGAGASTAAAQIDDLARAIRDFIAGFERVDVGRFEAQALDWVQALEDFDRRIAETLGERLGGVSAEERLSSFAESLFGTGDLASLTEDQLVALQAFIQGLADAGNVFGAELLNAIDVLQAAAGLEGVEAAAAGKILSMYEGTLAASSRLAEEYASINADFLDVATALGMLADSADELAAAEEVHQQRLAEFWDRALQGIRNLEESLRGPGDTIGAGTPRQEVQAAQARFDELAARTLEDLADGQIDDFETLEAFDAAAADLAQLMEQFTGGVGGEFNAFASDMLAVLEQIQPPEVPAGPSVQESAASMVSEQQTANGHLSNLVDGVGAMTEELALLREERARHAATSEETADRMLELAQGASTATPTRTQ